MQQQDQDHVPSPRPGPAPTATSNTSDSAPRARDNTTDSAHLAVPSSGTASLHPSPAAGTSAGPDLRRTRRDHLYRRHSTGLRPQWPLGTTSRQSQLASSAFIQDSSLAAASYPPRGTPSSPLSSRGVTSAGLTQPQLPSQPQSSPPGRVKRSSRQAKSNTDRAMGSGPAKKARTGASPPRRLKLPPSSNPRPGGDGPSPLFFSHAAARAMSRPPGLSSAGVAGSMLPRPRDDPAGIVTTLTMPRASVSSATPTKSGSTPGSLNSADISAHSLSPDNYALPQSLQGLTGVGVIELFENDDRPTFLIDLTNPAHASRPALNTLYYNACLRASQDIQQLVSIEDDTIADSDFGKFKSWVTNVAKGFDERDLHLPYHNYGGITWTCVTVRRRFRFISGTVDLVSTRSTSPLPIAPDLVALDPDNATPYQSMPVSPTADPIDPPDYFGDMAAKSSRDGADAMDVGAVVGAEVGLGHPDEFTNQVLQSQPLRSIFDWTRLPLSDSLPEHIKFAKMVDWDSTPLGPIGEWAYDLRAMSNLIMGSPHPAAMYWGPEFVCIYNAAHVDLAGQKHPSMMGSRYEEAWCEIWDEIKPTFQSAWESGQATMKHDNQLFIDRHGFLEETFFSWSIVPLLGVDGDVVGLYNPAFENTRRRVNERRMLTLREIGEQTTAATSVGEFWPQVQKGLEYNEFDIPFSIIYSVKEESESETASLQSGSGFPSSHLILEGSPGVPPDHIAAPATMDLRLSEDGFAPHMRQSLTMGGVPVVLSEELGNLPSHLLDGLQWRGFGDACKTIVVFPVVPTTTAEAVTGFIVMGTNPRRPYDDDYKLFIHLLSRQLATSLASVVLFEEEIRRGQRAARLAALDRQELSMQLLLRTQEANESEDKFTRMAAFAPVGMFIADSDGHINYCNDMWWQISRHSRSEENETAWMNSVMSEDRAALDSAWTRLLENRVTISVEFRFKASQQSGDNTIDTWVLMSAFPEKTEDGALKSIFGCITDISSQKWAEKVQNERREEAVELKRQQENFIDITSHEMRNPLSAVLQCADQIANNITAFAGQKNKDGVETLLEGCLDAANTINLCASHQKRIVDDILTLSKLDSSLLAVTPIDEQPVRVVQNALKMFESELVTHDIEFEFHVDETFGKYGVKWVKLDPSRLRQVLINLMTNAIKFTQGRERRHISVRLSASRDIEEVTSKGIFYFERNDNQRAVTMDIDNDEEWGTGERINIHCSVEDTGPGLGKEELKLLFQRFQQASPRTHVQYGGSGLGLFISRILTEMQGGQIGVSSEKGSGSKFNFYIQSRKCIDPPVEFEQVSPLKIMRKAHSPGVSSAASQRPAGSPARNMSDSGSGQLFDVLIVEDNIVNQKVLQRQLNNCGNNTFVANHGREALQTLQRSRFWTGQEKGGVEISVVLMDLEMPVMDGMTCARKIRELERDGTIVRHIPIIAVTAYARPEQIENAKAAGIDDVISKPFRIPELIPKIEELVSKYNNLSIAATE